MPSNISKVTLQTTPLHFSTFSGFNVAKTRGEHSLFNNAGALRVDCTAGPVAANGVSVVTFAKNAAAGDTIYLSYFANEIASVRLTDPPPAGVTMFTTDNLSGCKFFVDTINGSNDVIVYHANARAQSPPSNHGAVNPVLELPGCTLELNRLHTAAMVDWALAPTLVAGGEVDKPHYNLGARALTQHKHAMGRTRVPQPNDPVDPLRRNRPEYAGGTVIFGFYTNRWKFYYQSWGAVEYRRPKLAPKGWGGHRDVAANQFRLVGYGRIFPLPATNNIL
jgi:hypothetical protein